MPSWPTSIWAPTTKVATVTSIAAAHMNDAQSEIVSLETVIGIVPLTVVDNAVPDTTPVSIAEFMDFVATLLKGITGRADWVTAPFASLLVHSDGWDSAGDTWVFVTASTFKVTGVDVTATYTAGLPIRWKDGGAYKYGNVASSAFAAGDTTVTIVVNTDYVIANATLTDNYHSHDLYPLGFPAWFNYTPTGVSATNVTLTGRYRMSGRVVEGKIHFAFTGAITFTTMPTLPIAASAGLTTYDDGDADLAQVGGAAYFDNGTATVIGTLFPNIPSNSTTLVITNSAGANISATVPITWAASDALSVWFRYEV